ncbi:MAG: NTP transferase domain-containing protein [Chloroflexi bacterium]|nr:NTP transferase domain-containing protein [Chloroflexota bacterium]
MKVVILCGGKGTRMAEANYAAKALVDIGGRPILWHIMKVYAAYNFNEFVLTLGHGGDAIKQYFLDYKPMTRDFTLALGEQSRIEYLQDVDTEDWQITMADTGLETNKGGRLARVIKYLEGEVFHLTYGDGLGDIDLTGLVAFHKSHGKIATVTGYQPYSQYGILNLSEAGEVTGFQEKPRLLDWINAGFMIFEPEVRDYLTDDLALDLEMEIMKRLAEDGELMMYQHEGFWRSMDTFKEAQEMDRLWHEGAPWKVWA